MRRFSSLRALLVALFTISMLLTTCAPGLVLTPTLTPVPSDTAVSPEEGALTPTETVMPPTATAVPPAESAVPPAAVSTSTPAPSSELVFASFDKPAVRAEPVIHHEAIAPDLSNVRNSFLLSQAQLERLSSVGFAVSPGREKEFFSLYERARYSNVPIFVTTDSVFHVYHLLFDKVLRTAEVQRFIPMLRDLNGALLAQTDEIYRTVQGTDWEDAARRTVAFVGVASKVLDPEVQVPTYAADLVEAEVALIEDAAGVMPSPIFPDLTYGEDYTQYIPRGHYTKSDALQAYFKSMMWYGRMTFRVSRSNETRSALLLVHALRTTQVKARPALDPWADLYSSTVFFVGRSDDLTVLQYGKVVDKVYGEGITVEDLVDEALLAQFIAEAKLLPPPRILGIVVMDTDDVEEETKGMRFMGQRFVPDAYIFRELIYRNVGTRENRRGLPKGLDIPAAMGSERAYQLLDEMGETDYKNYDAQMEKMQAWLAGLSVDEWTETLYNAWLYCFHALLDVPDDGYPAFMRSLAWADKQLNTVLGSFAELKHDTILYAKQAYAELGGGPPPPPASPPRGYVEPVPEFYAGLAALTEMTLDGLGQRGLLVEQDRSSLQRLHTLARSLQTMAEKELRGEPLTAEEYETIRFYGGEMEHLTMAAADTPEGEQPGTGGQVMPEEEPQAAVIADVATDPDPEGDGTANPVVLELGVGRVDELHAVVPLIEEDGSITLQVAKGGVFSYYEFQWPADDRLTDKKWREMLAAGEAPPRPDWISSFYSEEGEQSALMQGVSSYLQSLVSALWYVEPQNISAGPELQRELAAGIEALQAAERYEGRTLMGVDFRSFDRQSDDLAVVTVRETWRDALYEGEYPDYAEEPVAERGPYTLDVTYALERGDYDRWQVTRAVYADEPPEWQ